MILEFDQCNTQFLIHTTAKLIFYDAFSPSVVQKTSLFTRLWHFSKYNLYFNNVFVKNDVELALQKWVNRHVVVFYYSKTIVINTIFEIEAI